MPAVYQVSVYKGNPDDRSTWELLRWEYGMAGIDPLDAAKRVARELLGRDEPFFPAPGLPSTKEEGWLFTQRKHRLIYEVERLKLQTRELGFMTPREREELTSQVGDYRRTRW